MVWLRGCVHGRRAVAARGALESSAWVLGAFFGCTLLQQRIMFVTPSQAETVRYRIIGPLDFGAAAGAGCNVDGLSFQSGVSHRSRHAAVFEGTRVSPRRRQGHVPQVPQDGTEGGRRSTACVGFCVALDSMFLKVNHQYVHNIHSNPVPSKAACAAKSLCAAPPWRPVGPVGV